jgi:hypothetical protein
MLVSTCVACGTRYTDIVTSGLCCIHDPRCLMVCANGATRRDEGDWCLWCGDTIKEGQSFCHKRCSNAYHEDMGCWLRSRGAPSALRGHEGHNWTDTDTGGG